MSLLHIDREKCKRDGICIESCPLGIIEFQAKGAYPTLMREGAELCIQCGHCVAVCPHQAMSHAKMTAQQCPPIRKELLLTPGQAEQFLRMRRSIRVYKDKTAERDQLSKLIHIARYAPSGHNTQPVEWLVVYDKSIVYQLASMVIDWMRHLIQQQSPFAQAFHMDRIVQSWEEGVERIFRNAPHAIIAHASKDLGTAQSSSTIALAYLELIAPVFGLGACWAGYFMAAATFWPPVMEALKLPEGHAVFGALMVGYPKFHYHRLPLRQEPSINWL